MSWELVTCPVIQVTSMNVEEHWVHVVHFDGHLSGKLEVCGQLLDLQATDPHVKDITDFLNCLIN